MFLPQPWRGKKYQTQVSLTKHKFIIHSPRKKCPYSKLFWSAFHRIRAEYGQIRSICPCSVRMWENADQNNSEYWNFFCSDYFYYCSLFSPTVNKLVRANTKLNSKKITDQKNNKTLYTHYIFIYIYTIMHILCVIYIIYSYIFINICHLYKMIMYIKYIFTLTENLFIWHS